MVTCAAMPTPESLFLATSARTLTASLMDKLERALPLLADDEIWWRPNEATNSAGNLVLHLIGSTRFWIGSVAGGAPNTRLREREFSARGGASRDELLDALRTAVAEADSVLEKLPANALLDVREGFGRPVTVLEAVYHGVAHFAMHTGQILQIVKIRRAADLQLPL
jgi:uncharacterized damage-inducible protein DinB